MFRIKKPLNKIVYTEEGDFVVATILVEIEDDKDPGVVVNSTTITSKIHESRSRGQKISHFKANIARQIKEYLSEYVEKGNFDTVFASVQISLEDTTWEESA